MTYEVWKSINGYKGYYEVSNRGYVRGVTRTVPVGNKQGSKIVQGRTLKSRISNNGYVSVTLSKFGKFKYPSIHRLVAIAFIPNHKNLPQVNHLDGNKLNNNDWNLEWSTMSENAVHALDTGLTVHGDSCSWSKLTNEQVLEIYNRSHNK